MGVGVRRGGEGMPSGIFGQESIEFEFGLLYSVDNGFGIIRRSLASPAAGDEPKQPSPSTPLPLRAHVLSGCSAIPFLCCEENVRAC